MHAIDKRQRSGFLLRGAGRWYGRTGSRLFRHRLAAPAPPFHALLVERKVVVHGRQAFRPSAVASGARPGEADEAVLLEAHRGLLAFGAHRQDLILQHQ